MTITARHASVFVRRAQNSPLWPEPCERPPHIKLVARSARGMRVIVIFCLPKKVLRSTFDRHAAQIIVIRCAPGHSAQERPCANLGGQIPRGLKRIGSKWSSRDEARALVYRLRKADEPEAQRQLVMQVTIFALGSVVLILLAIKLW